MVNGMRARRLSMKKLLLFAAVAGLGLVSASPPDKGPDNGPREGARHYPPCSRTVTDRCIQLNEHHARHYAARGGGHVMHAPAAADRRLAHRVRRAGERG
jgi:hypothetical protein